MASPLHEILIADDDPAIRDMLTRAFTRDLLTRTRLTSQQVLKQAGLTWEQIDRVLLVGGSTHMPMTGAMLNELTGKVPDNSLAVSEVVARGAALHAGIMATQSETESVTPTWSNRRLTGPIPGR